MENVVFDYKGIRNTVNEIVIKGDALFNSHVIASGLYIQSLMKKEEQVKVLNLKADIANSKLRLELFINDSQTDLFRLLKNASLSINKVTELRTVNNANMKQLNAAMSAVNSKALTQKDIAESTQLLNEFEVLKEQFEHYNKLQEQANNCADELTRCETYLSGFISRVQELITTTDDLATFHS